MFSRIIAMFAAALLFAGSAAAQQLTVTPIYSNGVVVSVQCMVGWRAVQCPAGIGYHQLQQIGNYSTTNNCNGGMSISLGVGGRDGSLRIGGCVGGETVQQQRVVVVQQERRPVETVVERRVEVERKTETRIVPTMREPFCEEKGMRPHPYNGILQCAEISGGTVVRVLDTVLYRLVPARDTNVVVQDGNPCKAGFRPYLKEGGGESARKMCGRKEAGQVVEEYNL